MANATQGSETGGGYAGYENETSYQPNPTPSLPTSVLKVGSRGNDVSLVQQRLLDLGYNVGTVDGIFGSATASALRKYQSDAGLTSDGIYGNQTRSALLASGSSSATSPRAMSGSYPVQGAVNSSLQAGPTPVSTVKPADRSAAMAYNEVQPGPAQTAAADAQATNDAISQVPGSTGDGVSQAAAVNRNPTPEPTGGSGKISSVSTKSETSVSVPGQTVFSPVSGGTDGGTGAAPISGTNQYWNQLSTMQFTYDPVTDPDYQQTSKVLENQVSQMMVARGGLYSSVARAALTSKLIELQIAMRKEKYNEYLQERAFVLQLAQVEFAREDAAWEKDMKTKEFNRQLANDAFSQQMQIAQFKFNIEQAAFERSMALKEYNLKVAAANRAAEEAKVAKANAALAAKLNTAAATYSTRKTAYVNALSEYENTGHITEQQAKILGIPMTAINDRGSLNKYLRSAKVGLDSDFSYLQQMAVDAKDSDMIQATYFDFRNSTPATASEPAYTVTEDYAAGVNTGTKVVYKSATNPYATGSSGSSGSGSYISDKYGVN